MKKLLILLMATATLTACSHRPPKPYGKPFPINTIKFQATESISHENQ